MSAVTDQTRHVDHEAGAPVATVSRRLRPQSREDLRTSSKLGIPELTKPVDPRATRVSATSLSARAAYGRLPRKE